MAQKEKENAQPEAITPPHKVQTERPAEQPAVQQPPPPAALDKESLIMRSIISDNSKYFIEKSTNIGYLSQGMLLCEAI